MWNCPICNNMNNVESTCSNCGYTNYEMSPVTTPSPTPTPVPQPTPVPEPKPTPVPQLTPNPQYEESVNVMETVPPISTPTIEESKPLPQNVIDPNDLRFMNQTDNSDGSTTIYDRDYGYKIIYTSDGGYVGYLDGKEMYHIYPDKMVSLKLYDDELIKLNNGSEDIVLLNSDLQIQDMQELMVKDYKNNTYYVNKGHVEKVDYSNGNELLEVGDQYFLLRSDGTYSTGANNESEGTYSFEKNDVLVLKKLDNTVVYYNSYGDVIKEIDSDGVIHNYEKNSISRNINGNNRFSKVNYIEYDDEAYDIILKKLYAINEEVPNIINSSMNSTYDTIGDLPDKYSTDEIDTISNNIQTHFNLIVKLHENTNYSLLAYQTCDFSIMREVKRLIDKLFSDNRDPYLSLFKDLIQDDVEERDGIIEYKENASFKNDLDLNLLFDIANYLYDGINAEDFGMTNKEIYRECKIVMSKYGINRVRGILSLLCHHCPENYHEYNFNPKKQNEGDGHYDYDSKNIRNFDTNSEFIQINGYEFEFAQVLPKNCTSIELIAYDIIKANAINTMRTLPDSYLNAASQKNNVIVLTCDHTSVDYNGISHNWAGYYNSANFLYPEDGTVVIDIEECFKSEMYYLVVDVLIHELGHKFDDIMNKMGKFDIITNYYTSNNKEWQTYGDRYANVIDSLTDSGYTYKELKEKTEEFFAESMVVYFTKPDEIKRFCPDMYDAISELLGGDYGGAYTNNIGLVSSPNN